MTIFGVSLTEAQIGGGNVSVYKPVYILSSTSWSVTTTRDTAAIDLTDSVDLATKESLLGSPAANGYILSSTTAGVRSWIPSTVNIALQANMSTSGNLASTETTIRSVSVSSNLLPTDGSSVLLKFTGQFGSNAAAKTLKVKFNNNDVFQNLINTSPNGVDFVGEVIVTRQRQY